jgi:hypothetical protein
VFERSEKFIKIQGLKAIKEQNGYKYTFDRLLKSGVKTWRCSKRKSKIKCKSNIHTDGDLIIRQYHTHNHSSQENYSDLDL